MPSLSSHPHFYSCGSVSACEAISGSGSRLRQELALEICTEEFHRSRQLPSILDTSPTHIPNPIWSIESAARSTLAVVEESDPVFHVLDCCPQTPLQAGSLSEMGNIDEDNGSKQMFLHLHFIIVEGSHWRVGHSSGF